MADFEKSLAELKEALLVFCDALDAAVVQLRRNLQNERANEKRLTYDAEKIRWEPREGPKGRYQLATVQNNVVNPDFAILKTVLKDAQSPVYGKNHLYWLMQDGQSLGRKEKARKEVAP